LRSKNVKREIRDDNGRAKVKKIDANEKNAGENKVSACRFEPAQIKRGSFFVSCDI
jgi:hypothetical protein